MSLRSRRLGPWVRPWALAGPILVLLIAAPLVRPLLQPAVASGRERATLLSVRSLLTNHSLSIRPPADLPAGDFYRGPDGRIFGAEPPVFSVYLAGVAWGIERTGVRFDRNPLLLEYLLIFFAVVVPTALACGLLYRCGRVFELTRPWRVALALACVLATGWLSFAVVLLPHALATALVTASAASVVHVLIAKKPNLAVGWLLGGGFAAGAAAAIEPSAGWALLAMPAAVLALPHGRRVRFFGLLLCVLGATSPLALHVSLCELVTGDWLPPRWHMNALSDATAALTSEDRAPGDVSAWASAGRAVNRFFVFTIGSHGVLSHFPILVVAAAGTLTVLRRHWPRSVKCLAGGAALGLLVLVCLRTAGRVDPSDVDFAAPKLLTPLPILLLCGGAWLRRTHPPATRVTIALAAVVSVVITLIGAAAPAPPEGYTGYTAAQAVERLLLPARSRTADSPASGLKAAVAGRS
ncbi:MAG TPA: hypothetical protein VF624_07780 [Tepidisphaeraceae bacterium]|jgi:hypothetical protein